MLTVLKTNSSSSATRVWGRTTIIVVKYYDAKKNTECTNVTITLSTNRREVRVRQFLQVFLVVSRRRRFDVHLKEALDLSGLRSNSVGLFIAFLKRMSFALQMRLSCCMRGILAAFQHPKNRFGAIIAQDWWGGGLYVFKGRGV